MTWMTALDYDVMVQDNLQEARRHADTLAEDPERWYRALVMIQHSIQAQFTQRKAKALAYQNECYSRGQAGRRDWWAFEAEELTWRGKAQFKLQTVTSRLREAKRLRQERYASERPVSRRISREPLLAHRERLAALVDDDAIWPSSLVSKTTRLRLRGLLQDLAALLDEPCDDERE
jgi:hypothetical protein